jgi:hypothetical protein
MIDLNRQIRATQARQGGFSAHVLPEAVGYGAATTVIVYSDGTSEPVITGGPLRTDSGAIASVGSGGPFGEAYFQSIQAFTFAGPPLALGTGDYTVEAWYRRTSTANELPRVVQWYDDNEYTGVQIYANPVRNDFELVPAPNINVFTSGDSYYHIVKGITLGVWRHIVVQRRGNLLEAWDNGSKITAVWFNDDYTEPLDFSADTVFYVADNKIDIGQIRIIPNKAMYPSGATITVPTAPFFTPPA